MLYKVVLANTLGQHSHKPFLTAYVRLCCLLASGTAVGLFVAAQLPQLPTRYPSTLILMLAVVVVVQVWVLVTLLSMQNIVQPATDTITRVLLVLPLRTRQLWVSLLVPRMVITSVGLTLILPPLWLLLHVQLHTALLCASILLGTCMAQLALLAIPKRPLLQIGSAIALVAAELALLSRATATTSIAAVVLCALLAITCYAGARTLLRPPVILKRKTSQVIGSALPHGWWFIKKIARAETTQLGCISGVAICACLALALRDHMPVVYTLPAALFAAAATADIRSLSKPHHSLEVMARGVGYFFRSQAIAAGILGTLVAIPFLASSLSAAGLSYTLVLLSYILLGGSVGLFASTLIAPGQRDISSQLLATLLCSAIVLAVSVMLPANLAIGLRIICNIGTAILFTALAATIEYYRNPFVWRKS
jgi:hypothetical protein